MVNQFPNEVVLTVKDLFAESAQRFVVYKHDPIPDQMIKNRGPDWLPMTFNLYSELPQFIKHFKEREARYVYDFASLSCLI